MFTVFSVVGVINIYMRCKFWILVYNVYNIIRLLCSVFTTTTIILMMLISVDYNII